MTAATTDPWRPIGGGQWVGTDMSVRYPLYTRANAGEVYPMVYRPLSFSIAYLAGEQAMRNAFLHSGLIRPDDLDGIPITTGLGGAVLGGYAYLNLSVSRLASARVPGSAATDGEVGMLGAAEAPPYEPIGTERNVRATIAGLRYAWKLARTTEIPQLDADQRDIERYLESLPDPATATDRELLNSTTDELTKRFMGWFETHLIVSAGAGGLLQLLSQLLEKPIDDPTVATRLLSGIGDVSSAAPSLAMWSLGRRIEASGELTSIFEAGVPGVMARLIDAAEPPEASDRPVAEFLEEFAAFTDEFGSRGPNEWDTAFDTWETDPELALTLIDRMRLTEESHAPSTQRARLERERDELESEVLGTLKWPVRGMVRNVLAAARAHMQGRERAKTNIVKAIHGARLSGQELDRRLVERSGGQRGDLWFLVKEELDAYLDDPASFLSIIEERRELHDRLSERIPPFYVQGELPPIEEWELRTEIREQVRVGDTLTGLSGCVGVARGRARVVTDPGDPRGLEPGDVLIAPHTDPSWTPLFVPAEAVIVDVGAPMSHAVIVSRELGIPCAISVVDATRRIPDGALIEVDGGAGTVQILELPA